MSKKRLLHAKILTSWLGVLGLSVLSVLPVHAQLDPIYRRNTTINGRSSIEPLRVEPGIPNPNGTSNPYPYGSRIDETGRISTPRGQVVYPGVRINNGDGSTTYYYNDGTSITIDKTKLPSIGAPLR
jgi:hypothetical protein